MNWGEVRQLFPALTEKTFLDAACVSLAPRTATDAIQAFLERALLCPEPSSTEHHIVMDELRAQARPEAARLINAHEDEIALVESTTHGLSLAANAIPLERGDRVLLSDLEFLEVAVPWLQKKREVGVEIDLVPNRNGRVHADDIADRMGPRTKVLAISSVQWSNGFRCDLNALGTLCRERQVWLVVDAIQHLGTVPLDVKATPVDFLAGYLSLTTPEGGWGQYFQTPTISPLYDYRFVEEAHRYELGGTANYPGAVGLDRQLPGRCRAKGLAADDQRAGRRKARPKDL
jgi:selenocysteine lyase/cysteine desulfurase